MICFVFYKTNDVFRAEEILQQNHIDVEIVPTPVQDKAYCGICIRIDKIDLSITKDYLSDLDYVLVDTGDK